MIHVVGPVASAGRLATTMYGLLGGAQFVDMLRRQHMLEAPCGWRLRSTGEVRLCCHPRVGAMQPNANVANDARDPAQTAEAEGLTTEHSMERDTLLFKLRSITMRWSVPAIKRVVARPRRN